MSGKLSSGQDTAWAEGPRGPAEWGSETGTVRTKVMHPGNLGGGRVGCSAFRGDVAPNPFPGQKRDLRCRRGRSRAPPSGRQPLKRRFHPSSPCGGGGGGWGALSDSDQMPISRGITELGALQPHSSAESSQQPCKRKRVSWHLAEEETGLGVMV